MAERKQYMKIWDAVKLLLLFTLFQVITSIILTLIANKLNFNENHPLLNSLSSIIALLLCLRRVNKNFYLSIRSRFNTKGEDRRFIPGLIIIAIGMSIVISEVSNYLLMLFPMSDLLEEIFSQALGGEVSLLGAFIGAVIVAPIVEEILMRGIILEGFTRKYSNIKAVVVSSLLFGIIHFNVYQFVAASIVGLLLGWLYVNTRSLLLCIFTHGVYNSIGFIVGDFLKLEISGYTVEGFQPLWFTGMGALLILVGAFVLKKTSQRKLMKLWRD